jgi:hypothetical protein
LLNLHRSPLVRVEARAPWVSRSRSSTFSARRSPSPKGACSDTVPSTSAARVGRVAPTVAGSCTARSAAGASRCARAEAAESSRRTAGGTTRIISTVWSASRWGKKSRHESLTAARTVRILLS